MKPIGLFLFCVVSTIFVSKYFVCFQFSCFSRGSNFMGHSVFDAESFILRFVLKIFLNLDYFDKAITTMVIRLLDDPT